MFCGTVNRVMNSLQLCDISSKRGQDETLSDLSTASDSVVSGSVTRSAPNSGDAIPQSRSPAAALAAGGTSGPQQARTGDPPSGDGSSSSTATTEDPTVIIAAIADQVFASA